MAVDYHVQTDADALRRIARRWFEEDACATSGIETSPSGYRPDCEAEI